MSIMEIVVLGGLLTGSAAVLYEAEKAGEEAGEEAAAEMINEWIEDLEETECEGECDPSEEVINDDIEKETQQ